MVVITCTLTAIAAALVTLAVAFLFIASARAEEAPDWAVRIMDETHKRVIVDHQNWYARDFRYVGEGEEVWGNCSTFSTTAVILGIQSGHDGEVIQCGPRHVVAAIEGWMFDSRERSPVRVSCE